MWRCGQLQQLDGLPSQDGADSSPAPAAKTDNFFSSFVEPHFGHGVPSQLVVGTNISLSAPHFSQ
jgi:hypothetical protein